MSMRKYPSKRRWKARFRMGQWIPLEAVLNHRLEHMVVGAERDALGYRFRKAS